MEPFIDFKSGARLNLKNNISVMGVINCTPDSFYDGGKYRNTGDAVESALRMEEEGAEIIDIGGESTRPGSKRISAEEELSRVLPVIGSLRKKSKIIISVDTYKSEVARAAIENGADMVNDIGGFDLDPKMGETIAKLQCPVIIGHISGVPETMQNKVKYDDTVKEVRKKLEEKICMAVKFDIKENSIIIDPGIGFGKSTEDNLKLIKNIGYICDLGKPVAIGVSRKSFIGNILQLAPGERMEGSLAASSIAAFLGVSIIRTHDVKETVRTVKVVKKILYA